MFSEENSPMTDDVRHPIRSARGQTAAEERQRRQAEALRANLSRRKQQIRARTELSPSQEPLAPEPDLAPDRGSR